MHLSSATITKIRGAAVGAAVVAVSGLSLSAVSADQSQSDPVPTLTTLLDPDANSATVAPTTVAPTAPPAPPITAPEGPELTVPAAPFGDPGLAPMDPDDCPGCGLG